MSDESLSNDGVNRGHLVQTGNTAALPLEFGFDEQVNRVLEKYVRQDAETARLSRKFQVYYRLRPFIPIFARQLLQRGRNGNMDVPGDWFIHTSFMADMESAWRADCEKHPGGWLVHPWPGNYQFASVLTHDVETRLGVKLCDRLATLEERHGFRSAWNFIPHKYKIDPGLIRDLQDRGHEVGVHGYNHDGQLFLSKRKFDRRSKKINAALAEFDSVGFRAPMVHRNLDWLQGLNVQHDASCFDIDPFQAMPGGVGSLWPFVAGKFVELPYTLPQDHTLLIALGHKDIRVWQQKLEVIKRWRGMAMLITHPDYLDNDARLNVYRDWLVHLQGQSDMWPALPTAVSQWWRQRQESIVEVRGGSPVINGPAQEKGNAIRLTDLFAAVDDYPVGEDTTSTNQNSTVVSNA